MLVRLPDPFASDFAKKRRIIMKRTKDLCRRCLALILSFVLCVGMLSTTAFATEGGEAEGTEVTETQPAPPPAEPVKPEPKPEVKPEPTPEPETKPEAEPETQPESEQPEVTPEPAPEPEQPEGKPETTPEPERSEGKPEMETKPESKPEVQPEPETKPEGKPESKPEVITPAPSYASVNEFMNACSAMGGADDMDTTLAVLKNIESIYNRLSPLDKASASVSVAWAYVQSYRTQIDAGNPDEDVETLASNFNITFLVCCPSKGISDYPVGTNNSVSRPSSGYIQVPYRIPFLSSLTDVNFGRVLHVTSNAYFGGKSEGASCDLSRNNPNVTFRYYVSDWNTGGSSPNKISFTVNHVYYTNNDYDDIYTETQEIDSPNYSGSIFSFDLSRKTNYNGNTYSYTSSDPSSIYVKKGATGHQGTFTFRYDRTVQVTTN